MRSEFTELKCNVCGKTEKYNKATIGGIPFAGWIEITANPRTKYVAETYDVCSEECFKEFATQQPYIERIANR